MRGRLVLDRLVTREEWRLASRAPEGMRIGVFHPDGGAPATPVYSRVTSCNGLMNGLDGRTLRVFLVGLNRPATQTAPRRFAAIGLKLPENVWDTWNIRPVD